MRWLTRLLLFRFLPRRLLPVLTAWEVLQLIRNRNRDDRAPRRLGAPSVTPGAASRRPPAR